MHSSFSKFWKRKDFSWMKILWCPKSKNIHSYIKILSPQWHSKGKQREGRGRRDKESKSPHSCWSSPSIWSLLVILLLTFLFFLLLSSKYNNSFCLCYNFLLTFKCFFEIISFSFFFLFSIPSSRSLRVFSSVNCPLGCLQSSLFYSAFLHALLPFISCYLFLEFLYLYFILLLWLLHKLSF